jgi:hypothetical protein
MRDSNEPFLVCLERNTSYGLKAEIIEIPEHNLILAL